MIGRLLCVIGLHKRMPPRRPDPRLVYANAWWCARQRYDRWPCLARWWRREDRTWAKETDDTFGVIRLSPPVSLSDSDKEAGS